MSEKTPHRRPATFRLDDPGVVVMDQEDSSRPARGTVRITPETDPALLPVPLDAPLIPARRGFRWGTLFWAATAGLVLLGLGLGVVNLIEGLFARSESFGLLGLVDALAGVTARGPDHDAARVAQAVDVLLDEDPVVLVGQQPVRDRVVVL